MTVMKTSLSEKLCIATVLLLAAQAVPAQSIYKCTHNGQVAYTDHPCAKGDGQLIHQADDSEVIDKYLRLGQDALARQYADSRHLETLYKERVAAHQQQQEEQARRRQDEAIADQQRARQAEQQAAIDEAANRARLEAENDALRNQNDQYREQLNSPAYNAPPTYWGVAPPYWNRPPHHGHRPPGHRPPRPKEPIYHPCTQLAGGRVKC